MPSLVLYFLHKNTQLYYVPHTIVTSQNNIVCPARVSKVNASNISIHFRILFPFSHQKTIKAFLISLFDLAAKLARDAQQQNMLRPLEEILVFKTQNTFLFVLKTA